MLYLTNSLAIYGGGVREDKVQNFSFFLTISVSITVAFPLLEDFRGHAGSINGYLDIF